MNAKAVKMFGLNQWRIQHFPEGAPTYCVIIFFRKLHENEENSIQRERPPLGPLDPPV